MIERPLFVATRVGPIAAIVSLPDGDPVAALLVVQGYGSTRAGNNQTFARLARSLADEGVATLRADYAGTSESWDADPRERVDGVRVLAERLCELVPGVPLLVVSSCYGLSPSVSVTRSLDVAGIAVVVPHLTSEPSLAPRSTRIRDARNAFARVTHRLRYGSRYRTRHQQTERTDAVEALTELASRTPTWLLSGEHDRCLPGIEELLPTLREAGPVELEVVEGLILHAAPTPQAQDAIRDHVASWVRRCISSVDLRS